MMRSVLSFLVLLTTTLAACGLANANDCSGAADEARSRTGGEVLSVSTRQQDGETVCVITVLVPGEAGERPRRETIVLPG